MMAGNRAIMVVIVLSVLAIVLQTGSAAPFYYFPPKETYTDISTGSGPLYPIETDSSGGSGDAYSDDEDYNRGSNGSGEGTTVLPMTAEQLWNLFWTIAKQHGIIYTN